MVHRRVPLLLCIKNRLPAWGSGVPETIGNRWCEVWTPAVRKMVSMGIMFVPVIGNFYGMAVALGGYDPITGRHLSTTERLILGIGSAIGIGMEAHAILAAGSEVAMVGRIGESFADDAVRDSEGLAAKVADGCNSFSADTSVMTASGRKRISDVDVGDLVLAWDETTNTLGYFVVSDEIAHRDPLIVTLVIDGETIYPTWALPFWVEGKGWVAAAKHADIRVTFDYGQTIVQSFPNP